MTYQDFVKVGKLDSDLAKEYRERFGDKKRLTQDEALRFLKNMYAKYPEMKDLYPTPQDMINEAEENSKNHWFYRLRPCE